MSMEVIQKPQERPQSGWHVPKGGNKIRRLWLNIGKLILDATKLCFGSLVLGAAIKGTIPESTLMLVGVIVSTAGAIFGIITVTIAEEK